MLKLTQCLFSSFFYESRWGEGKSIKRRKWQKIDDRTRENGNLWEIYELFELGKIKICLWCRTSRRLVANENVECILFQIMTPMFSFAWYNCVLLGSAWLGVKPNHSLRLPPKNVDDQVVMGFDRDSWEMLHITFSHFTTLFRVAGF
jgi:hypothetical protein